MAATHNQGRRVEPVICIQEHLPAFLKTSFIIGQLHSPILSLSLSDPGCPGLNPVSLGPKQTSLLWAELPGSSGPLLLDPSVGSGHPCAVHVLPVFPWEGPRGTGELCMQFCSPLMHFVRKLLSLVQCPLKTHTSDFWSIWEFPGRIKLFYLDIKFYGFVN